MGLIVNVFRSRSDCTNGGISADADTLTVVNIDGPFNPTLDRPAVMLIDGPGGAPNPILVPAVQGAAGDWFAYKVMGAVGPMYGGNLAETSDSRWGAAVRNILGVDVAVSAVSIHDRFESAALNEAMSR